MQTAIFYIYLPMLEPFGLFTLLYKIYHLYIIMLNLNKVGRPLCKVEKGKYNGYIVSVSDQMGGNEDEDKEELIKEFKRLKIPNDSKFQHMPDTTRERESLYITGCSGSGKSTYTRKFVEKL